MKNPILSSAMTHAFGYICQYSGLDINISNGLISQLSKFVEKPTLVDNAKSNMIKLWAIPGLIDSHVHLFEIHNGEHKGEIILTESFELAKERALLNLAEALKVGVTCVRDVGAFSAFNNRFRDMIEEDVPRFKFRVISCGNHITKKNGPKVLLSCLQKRNYRPRLRCWR